MEAMLLKNPPDDLMVSPGRVDGPDLLLGSSVQGHVVLLRVEMDFVVGNLSQPTSKHSVRHSGICLPGSPSEALFPGLRWSCLRDWSLERYCSV